VVAGKTLAFTSYRATLIDGGKHMPARAKAQEILREIIRQSGGRMEGATRLYKTFYFAHLYYHNIANNILSPWPIVKMPRGPAPDKAELLLQELVNSGDIARGTMMVGPHVQITYELKVNRPSSLSEKEKEAIRLACVFVGQKGANELSLLTHEFSRSWNEAKSGEELNIYTDLITDDRYPAELEEMRKANELISSIF
jgi:hypothetical protein